MQRCTFCNNSILEFEQKHVEGTRVYHMKCAKTASATRETVLSAESKAEQEKRDKAQANFANQPKVIGEVILDDGAGFTIDPRTGEKKPVRRPANTTGYSPAGVKTQPNLQSK
eukprot:TRINITY_DN2216_c0_g1_i1.p1 TRINITY_DN2216_c0_g1~~TRINITY_DN2216_c0_g1_i1.p1  ORF type:complete len:113 (-),score=30.58 TRINITY_DN2216_c0_g1_i1:30-368(-)